MQEEFAVPVAYIRQITEQLRFMQVDVDGWLARAGMRADQLAEPSGVVSYARFRGLVLSAVEEAQEPALGLFVGERLVASTHGIVGTLAIHSRNVGQALTMLERFAGLRTSLVSISHAVVGDEVRVLFEEARPLGDLQRPMFEALVLSIKNVLDDITMGTCNVPEVAFAFPRPDYASLATDLFGCPVLYGQDWTGFKAPAAVLEQPLARTDPEAFAAAEQICQAELDRLAQSETLAGRVRRLLLGHQAGFPSLQVTARLLHMTPRTLHRHLVVEGTSYRALLESVRRTLAVEQLKSGRFAVDEVAYQLGYTDVSNFRRAFKRWEGVAPSVYRARHAAGGDTGQ